MNRLWLIGFAPVLFASCMSVQLRDLFRERVEEKYVTGDPEAEAKIVLLPIHGFIVARPSGVLVRTPSTTPQRIRDFLHAVRGDASVRGVILDVNSPGGSANASDTIYRLIRDFKQETNLPIVAFCRDVAASGGYYIACAADEIVATPMSITGSIGVISYHMNLEPLMREKLGVEVKTLKAGEFKDTASPFKPLGDDERERLQSLLDTAYDQFLGVVSEGRGLKGEELKTATEGRIFLGRQAEEARLVDTVGYLSEAIGAIKNRTGVREARTVRYVRYGGLGSWLQARSASPLEEVASIFRLSGPKPLFLWVSEVR